MKVNECAFLPSRSIVMFLFVWKGSKKDCSVMIVLLLELLLLYIERVQWNSNDINKAHIQAIRVHFFCHFDICQLLLPMPMYVGLPPVLISHLSHQRNTAVCHDFGLCKAVFIKARFLIRKERPNFLTNHLLVWVTEELKISFVV